MTADRELLATRVIDARPAEVWAVLSNLGRMSEFSPETVRMVPLKVGGLRLGQWYLGINRRGWVIWPTRNVVAQLEPLQCLAWDTTSSGARWIYELALEGAGTRVVHRRPVPSGKLTLVSRLFAPLALGGSEAHAAELEAGMADTLVRLKRAVEG